MFKQQKTSLFESTSANSFVKTALKKAAKVQSGNGAKKYDTTGDPFVDQFGVMGSYKEPRSFEAISKDMSVLWEINWRLTIAFTFFLRLITRVINLFDGTRTSTVQRGSGLKHEGIMRMIWLHVNHRESFWNNIDLFISVGSWRDVFEMLRYDLTYNGWKGRVLDWDSFKGLLLAGLENDNTQQLVKKYLPQIKAKSACTTVESQANTMIGKWISSFLFGKEDYKSYRLFKSSGTAHQWQQLISKQLFDKINFNTVHGRALSLLVSGKFLSNNGLEKKYEAWIESKPIAKFTGYVNELFSKPTDKKYQIDTLNAQFMGLVETAKKGAKTNTGLIVVRDTSGSMSSLATGSKQSCFDIAKSLALFFSYMLPDGYFSSSFIEFNSTAKFHQWKGTTPYEKWQNDQLSFYGSTNFQSVINLFCDIRKKGVPENEFPTGILCVSDGEFNQNMLNKTNVKAALLTLSKHFSEEYVDNFKIILWNLQSSYYGNTTGKKFETYGDVKNVFYFSGYDGSIIAFLTGVDKQEKPPTTAKELFNAAMDQEILNMIR